MNSTCLSNPRKRRRISSPPPPSATPVVSSPTRRSKSRANSKRTRAATTSSEDKPLAVLHATPLQTREGGHPEIPENSTASLTLHDILRHAALENELDSALNASRKSPGPIEDIVPTVSSPSPSVHSRIDEPMAEVSIHRPPSVAGSSVVVSGVTSTAVATGMKISQSRVNPGNIRSEDQRVPENAVNRPSDTAVPNRLLFLLRRCKKEDADD